MRALAVVAGLSAALIILVFLLQVSGAERSGPRTPADPVKEGERRRALGRAPIVPVGEHEVDGRPAAARRLRLVYGEDSPAAGLVVHRAIGRPLHTRVYRNGDYPEKVIWLLTHHDLAYTKQDGSFSFPRVAGPGGARTILFTEPDAPAFLLEELHPAVEVLRAERKVKVSGLLLDERRRPLPNYRIEAQRGWPEDWNTRHSKEDDSFVTAQRDLELSPYGRCRAISGPDGLFELSLLPGTNILCFGAGREDGRRPLEVPNHDVDLGPVDLPPKGYREPGAQETLRGTVLDFAGRPAPGVEVRLWDGTVGQHSHVTDTDREGRFSFSDLRNDRVILWATSTIQPHLVIPSQCSGTVHLPCNTPIVLRVPTRREYWWARPTALPGFYLFIRDGVFLNGSSDIDVVGVPPGSYRVILLSRDRRILEGTFSVTDGGSGELSSRIFRNVTWQ